MDLFLVRHGIAEDLGGSVHSDADRRLTERGRERTREIAKFLHKRQPEMEKIFHSSYRRAVETAEIFADFWPEAKVMEKAGLLPMDSVKKSAVMIEAELKHVKNLMVVGHEPHLSHLLGLLLTGNSSAFMDMKKAGIAHLEYDEYGRRQLLALIPPKYSLCLALKNSP